MTKCEQLIYKVNRCIPKGREWLDLEMEVQQFLKEEATAKEKEEIAQYSEMLYMMCRAIERKEKPLSL